MYLMKNNKDKYNQTLDSKWRIQVSWSASALLKANMVEPLGVLQLLTVLILGWTTISKATIHQRDVRIKKIE